MWMCHSQARWFKPAADAQLGSVVHIQEIHAQVERLVFVSVGVPRLPQRVKAPHVVEDVQLEDKSDRNGVNVDHQEAQLA